MVEDTQFSLRVRDCGHGGGTALATDIRAVGTPAVKVRQCERSFRLSALSGFPRSTLSCLR